MVMTSRHLSLIHEAGVSALFMKYRILSETVYPSRHIFAARTHDSVGSLYTLPL